MVRKALLGVLIVLLILELGYVFVMENSDAVQMKEILTLETDTISNEGINDNFALSPMEGTLATSSIESAVPEDISTEFLETKPLEDAPFAEPVDTRPVEELPTTEPIHTKPIETKPTATESTESMNTETGKEETESGEYQETFPTSAWELPGF